MEDLNLYTRYLHDKHKWYHDKRVKEELGVYIDYLKRIENYQKKKEKIDLDYEVSKTGVGLGCQVTLTDPGEIAKQQLYDQNVPVVYEFDPDLVNTFSPKHRIKIISRDAGECTLLLERRPTKPMLAITSHPYQIIKQRMVVEMLAYAPLHQHLGLLKLFQEQDKVEWSSVRGLNVNEWFELDKELDGVREQREFVKRALATPDFAFLEGPPGSGKTTVLCELIRQLVNKEKRVLFCASTHVAVDNLLERLVVDSSRPAKNLIPLRIGDSDNISEHNKPYQYDVFLKNIKERISVNLAKKDRSRARRMMLEELRKDDTVGRIARDCANLVCGTTIGILRHPDIKDGTLRRFDVMIIDEASKTTLAEFLVPAVHADRWIISGDTRQLAPYTDDEEIAMSVNSCIQQPLGDVCVDAFMATKRPKAGPTIIVTRDASIKQAYQDQCADLGVKITDVDVTTNTNGRILIGSPTSLLRIRCPDHPSAIRNGDLLLAEIQGRNQKSSKEKKRWIQACRQNNKEDMSWGEQVGWRIRALFPYVAQTSGQKIREEVAKLMPVRGTRDVDCCLYQTEKVALPSILEILQHGFSPIQHFTPDSDGIADRLSSHNGTAITAGMPAEVFGERHILLEWQHRMHPDIAAFSNRHIYNGAALRTSDFMKTERGWTYDAYRSRLEWIVVHGRVIRNKSYSNEEEARRIVHELSRFCRYANAERRSDSRLWTVAILSFYKGQVAELRKHIQKFTGQDNNRQFLWPSNNPAVSIELHTVDSFQGHEADIVFLSMVRDHPTIFLNHPNRINVAITRARYQCVIVGNKSLMESDPPLSELVKNTLGVGWP